MQTLFGTDEAVTLAKDSPLYHVYVATDVRLVTLFLKWTVNSLLKTGSDKHVLQMSIDPESTVKCTFNLNKKQKKRHF